MINPNLVFSELCGSGQKIFADAVLGVFATGSRYCAMGSAPRRSWNRPGGHRRGVDATRLIQGGQNYSLAIIISSIVFAPV